MKMFVCDECGKEEEGIPSRSLETEVWETEVWVEPAGKSTDTYEIKVTISKQGYHGEEPVDLCSACVLKVVQRVFSAKGLREAKEVDEWRTDRYMGSLV